MTPEALAALPPYLLANLEQTLLQGNVDGIHEAIYDVHSYNPIVTDTLAGLANNFAYGKILKLIQEAKEHKINGQPDQS